MTWADVDPRGEVGVGRGEPVDDDGAAHHADDVACAGPFCAARAPRAH